MTGRRPATVVVILLVAAVAVALAVVVLRRDAPVSGGDASGATGDAAEVGAGSVGDGSVGAGSVGDGAGAGAATSGAQASAGPGATVAASAEVTQTWSGTLTLSEPAESVGTLVVTLSRQGSDLSGSLTTDASSCFSSGGVQGVVDGTAVEFSLLQRDEVEFEGEIAGETMSGTVSVACDDSQGSWTLTLQP